MTPLDFLVDVDRTVRGARVLGVFPPDGPLPLRVVLEAPDGSTIHLAVWAEMEGRTSGWLSAHVVRPGVSPPVL